MYCEKCGCRNEENAAFCANCGKVLVEMGTPEKKERERRKPPVSADNVHSHGAGKTVGREKSASTHRKIKLFGFYQGLLIGTLGVLALVLVLVLATGGKKGETSLSQDVQFTEQGVKEEVTPEAQSARQELYGTWGVYFGDVLQTITIREDGTIYVWNGTNEEIMNYTWLSDTHIQAGEYGYVYAYGQLLLFQNGEQSPFVYHHCPTLVGTPTVGAQNYEQMYMILTGEELFTEAQINCLPSFAKGAICTHILANKYGIDSKAAPGDFLKMISLPDKALAEQIDAYYAQAGGPVKLVITDWISRDDMIQTFYEEQQSYNAQIDPVHKQYIWELAQAENCWVAVGEAVYANGESAPLSTDTQASGPLYIFLIGGRYYWYWSALG